MPYPIDNNPADQLQAADDVASASYKPTIGQQNTNDPIQQRVAKELITKSLNPNPQQPDQAPSHHSVWGMNDNMFGERDPKTGIRPFNDVGNNHLSDMAKNNVGLISSLAHMSAPVQNVSGGQSQAPPPLGIGQAAKAYDAYESGGGLSSILEAL